MKQLEERIARDGRVIGTEILKVDSFLNHQMDIALLDEIGKELYRLFKDRGITKVITIEASGIATTPTLTVTDAAGGTQVYEGSAVPHVD